MPRNRKSVDILKPENITGDLSFQNGSNSKSMDRDSRIGDWASLRDFILREYTRCPAPASEYLKSLERTLRLVVNPAVGCEDESCQVRTRDVSSEGRERVKSEIKPIDSQVKVEEESVGARPNVQMKRGRGRPRKDAIYGDRGGSNSITNYLVKGQRPPSLESTNTFTYAAHDPPNQ
jgi:hypothetical protein